MFASQASARRHARFQADRIKRIEPRHAHKHDNATFRAVMRAQDDSKWLLMSFEFQMNEQMEPTAAWTARHLAIVEGELIKRGWLLNPKQCAARAAERARWA